MIFRLLIMIIQLMTLSFLIYIVLRYFTKKQAELRREELLDEHNERIKDKQLKQQLKRSNKNGTK